MKDPLYAQILETLEGPLDPRVFEAAACDLLRRDLPGLVPIPGGGDAGMDGAVADGEGEAFPLVCTTDQRVIRNLTRSLDRYREEGGRRRRVALATSRRLTPRRRRNLEKRAREKGFVLVQVFAREAIADRIYRDSRWLRDLLGLAGTPRALSVVPPGGPSPLEIPLIGREADLEWLRSTSGDCLVLGQPGSGKTHLLHQLVREGWGLFLTSEDQTAIASDLRSLKPLAIVVDDAHAHPGVLGFLRRLRAETRDFDLVATGWPGAEEEVSLALGGLPRAQVRSLELLTRDQILEVVRAAGITGSTQLLRELVDQAANKPGLAVTLAQLVLTGDLEEVVRGDALSREVVGRLRKLTEDDDVGEILAHFALGGEAGMELAAVAELFGASAAAFRSRVVGLSVAGTLTERTDRRLAVWPPRLRWALVRDVFFSGSATSLDYRPVLQRTPDPPAAVETIAIAALNGAEVADLAELVQRHGTREAWRALARRSRHDAGRVLDRYPGALEEIASATLAHAPTETALRLLEAAQTADGEPHARPRHPLRILQDWIREFDPQRPLESQVEGWLKRRRALVAACRRFRSEGGSPEVLCRGIFAALDARIESTRSDPGSGRTVTLSRGIIHPAAIGGLSELWSRCRNLLESLEGEVWTNLQDLLHYWIHPKSAAMGRPLPEELTGPMREFASEVLRDLRPLAAGSPGLSAGLQRLAATIDLDLELEQDPEFGLLFPDDGSETRAQLESGADGPSREQEIGQLARSWRERDPAEVVARIGELEAEARKIGQTWPRYTPDLCHSLATEVEEAAGWFDAFAGSSAPRDLAGPFLRRVVGDEAEGWEGALSRALEIPELQGVAIALLLGREDPPEELLRRVEGLLPRLRKDYVEGLAMRDELSARSRRRLLQHEDRLVALAVAVGLWNRGRRHEATLTKIREWREALLRAPALEDRASGLRHWLGELLRAHPDLALQWLLARIEAGELVTIVDDGGPVDQAVASLDEAARAEVLAAVTDDVSSWSLLPRLVDRSPGLFADLLDRSDLEVFHLTPLQGVPDASWWQLAKQALDIGHQPAEIARAAFDVPHVYGGKGEDHWKRWTEGFELGRDDPDQGLCEIASQGLTLVEQWLARERSEERRVELYGFR